MRPELLLLLPWVVLILHWFHRLRGGWMLTSPSALEGLLSEGELRGNNRHSGPYAATAGPGSPSESVPWPSPLPEEWTAEEVVLTLMDIEYAESYRP